LITGTIAALIAFCGNVVVTYEQGRNELKLKTKEHEATLIDSKPRNFHRRSFPPHRQRIARCRNSRWSELAKLAKLHDCF